jgi:hypothetical protein
LAVVTYSTFILVGIEPRAARATGWTVVLMTAFG